MLHASDKPEGTACLVHVYCKVHGLQKMRLVVSRFAAIHIGRETCYADLHSSLIGAFKADRTMSALLDMSLDHDSFIHARLQSTSKHFGSVSTPIQLSESKTAATLPAHPAIVRSQRLLQDFTAFDMDAYVAGKDKKWQFWNCEPSSFPFAYDKVEHLYMLAGKFSIQYEGAEPVTIVAGDFVSAQPAL